MLAILSIIFTVVFFGSIKAVVTVGLDADITSYKLMLSDLKVVEVALWFILAIVGRNVFLSADWYKGTHDSSVSTQLVQEQDGSVDEIVVSRWSQTPNFEASGKALKQTVFVFIMAAGCLTMFYILN